MLLPYGQNPYHTTFWIDKQDKKVIIICELVASPVLIIPIILFSALIILSNLVLILLDGLQIPLINMTFLKWEYMYIYSQI